MIKPVKLRSTCVERVWGVTPKAPWFPKVGEIWLTLDPPLPILIKFLFTTDKLSVQVHPDDAYAREHENSRGKTEMWYILDRDPGAVIALGWKRPVEWNEVESACYGGTVEELLEWVPVTPGDSFYTPAGTVHAIGSGITLCEIQQNSDVTYRMYDYDRMPMRDLHLKQSRDVTQLTPYDGRSQPSPLEDGWERLVESPHFVTDRRTYTGHSHYKPLGRESEILIVVDGAGRLAGEKLIPGQAWLIPQGSGLTGISAATPLKLLRTYVP